MKKRKFLKYSIISLLTVSFIFLYTPTAQATDDFELLILHTNDTHAHLESFTPYGDVNQGGVARRMTIVSLIRTIEDEGIECLSELIDSYVENGSISKGVGNSLTKKLDEIIKLLDKGKIKVANNVLNALYNEILAQYGKHINSDAGDVLIFAINYIKDIQFKYGEMPLLVLDAGDVFQGTLYFNYFKGLADAEFMNDIGYDAMAVGNHEFDAGQEVLADFIDYVNFPLLSANLDFSGTPILNGKVDPYIIFEFDEEQVGVFGLTTEDVAILSNIGEGILVNEIIETSEDIVAELEGEGINKIIALTHCGYEIDLMLADSVSGIDLIIGGHSHTKVDPYPTFVTSPAGEPVAIVQAEDWGRYLGKLDIVFDENGVVDIINTEGELIFLDESVPEDPVTLAKLYEYAQELEEWKTTIVGQAAVFLDGERAHVRTMETNLGNLICDAILERVESDGVEIAFQNGGGIRASIEPGDVSVGDIISVLPFGNMIVDCDVTGQVIWDALENAVSKVEDVSGRFLQVGGLRFTFDSSLPAGSRIVSVEIGNIHDGFVPIDLTATYRIALNDFNFGGGDGFDFTSATNVTETGLLLSDTLIDYFELHSPVYAEVEGKIINIEP
jgi:5'-nucleotidase